MSFDNQTSKTLTVKLIITFELCVIARDYCFYTPIRENYYWTRHNVWFTIEIDFLSDNPMPGLNWIHLTKTLFILFSTQKF